MSPGENPLKFDLDVIGTIGPVSNTPDPRTQVEVDSLAAHEKQKRTLEIRGIIQTLDQRKHYARATFGLVCIWLTCVLLISILQGLGVGKTTFYFFHFQIKFQLESGVMIALIATTTANIIAVLLIVMKYLFPNQKSTKP